MAEEEAACRASAEAEEKWSMTLAQLQVSKHKTNKQTKILVCVFTIPSLYDQPRWPFALVRLRQLRWLTGDIWGGAVANR